MKMVFKQDIDQAIEVMRMASRWMSEQGIEVSKWWKLENLNKEFLLKHSRPHHYYVGIFDDKPVVSGVLQMDQGEDDWNEIDQGNPPRAMYIHWWL